MFVDDFLLDVILCSFVLIFLCAGSCGAIIEGQSEVESPLLDVLSLVSFKSSASDEHCPLTVYGGTTTIRFP